MKKNLYFLTKDKIFQKNICYLIKIYKIRMCLTITITIYKNICLTNILFPKTHLRNYILSERVA